MQNTQILKPLDLNTLFSAKPHNAELVAVLKRLFSLENLKQDISLICKMDNDLWVPLSFIADLEPVRTLTKDYRQVREACKVTGLEYDYETQSVRKVFSAPRTKLAVWKEGDFSELGALSVKKQRDCTLLQFQTEEQTLQAYKHLRAAEYNCLIQSTSAYLFLLEELQKNLGQIEQCELYKCLNSIKTYEKQEFLELWKACSPKMPPTFKLLFTKCRVIKRNPGVN